MESVIPWWANLAVTGGIAFVIATVATWFERFKLQRLINAQDRERERLENALRAALDLPPDTPQFVLLENAQRLAAIHAVSKAKEKAQ